MSQIEVGTFQEALTATLEQSGLFKRVITPGQDSLNANYKLNGEILYQVTLDCPEKGGTCARIGVRYVLTSLGSDAELWDKTITTENGSGRYFREIAIQQPLGDAMQNNLIEMVRQLEKVRWK